MTTLPHKIPFFALALALSLSLAGCHGNQSQTADNSTTQPAADQGTDPAAVNLSPATYNTPDSSASGSAGSAAPADDSDDYSEPATETASEAPPALPDYQQPPDPGDGYIWTPGYWNYASTGYYWVPGAWVEPPYSGALWTPGYWGHTGSRYAFHPGHWGTHIGFYGGVNYGNGYTGLGYEGGYWNSGHFNYNRTYNNVNTTVVHNVYSYNVVNRETVVNRTSYNGGQGGIQVRPRQPEVAARQEPYAPRMNSQVQHAESFRNDRNQYVSVNHGQPARPVVTEPIHADQNVRPRAPEARGGPQRPVGPAKQMAQPNRNPHDDRH